MSKRNLIYVLSFLLTGLLVVASVVNGEEILRAEDHELTSYSITKFGQAPMLAKQVEKGVLPPAEERLPQDPYVVVPVERVGRYGGTARLASRFATAPVGSLALVGWNHLVRSNLKGTGIEVNFAKSVEVSQDYTTFTFNLRKGVKWSDGHPFTAEDIMFWYEDVLHNKDLTPAISEYWKGVEMTAPDDYTIRVETPEPQPYFLRYPISKGRPNGTYCMPKHYLKQFHPKYSPEEELKTMAKEAGFDHWYQLFQHKNRRYHQLPVEPDCPTLASFKPVKITSQRRVYERNPYYWKVDTAGNQLPYIDKFTTEVIKDMEVINGKIMSGEIDYKSFNLSLKDYPMFKKFEEKGGYRTVLWKSGQGTQVAIMFNLTHQDPGMREIFQDVRFRRAMSLAMNREEINQALYFGKAQPRQYTVLEGTTYYEPRFAKAYTEYDPQRAKELLDAIGIVDSNGDGWRERPSGDKFTFTMFGKHPLKMKVAELVASQWKDIGVDANTKLISGELLGTRSDANMLDAFVWYGDIGSTDMTFPIFYPNTSSGGWGCNCWPRWCDFWFGGAKEEKLEPFLPIPEEVAKLRAWYRKAISEPDDEKRAELSKSILQSQAENLWIIGTIGEAPHPTVLDEDLHNYHTFEDRIWLWDVTWASSNDPEQLFFDEDEGKKGNK